MEGEAEGEAEARARRVRRARAGRLLARRRPRRGAGGDGDPGWAGTAPGSRDTSSTRRLSLGPVGLLLSGRCTGTARTTPGGK
ncbi:hypothetical protein GCM10009719_02070 [Nocardioides kribbensis]